MRINFPTINIALISRINKYNTVSQPRLKPLEYDTFERISFGRSENSGKRTSRLAIKNIANLECPVCQSVMLNQEQINKYAQDVGSKRGEELALALEKYEDDSVLTGIKRNIPRSVYRPQAQQAVNIVKDLARKYPNKSLHELVRIERNSRIDNLIAEQLVIIEKMKEYVKTSDSITTSREPAMKILKDTKDIIRGESGEIFGKKRFIRKIEEVELNPGPKEELIKIAKTLPTSSNDANSWFVQSSKSRNSFETAKTFVISAQATKEHLKPKSKGGANRTDNYICDCSDCNAKRGNIDFDIWMKTIPDFERNLQKYLYRVKSAIERGIIPRHYVTYIDNIIETIYELSNGEIELRNPYDTER